MAKFDATKAVFEQIDTNRDGKINKNEFRKWISNAEGLPSSSYESSTSGFNLYDNTTSRFDRDKYTSYGTAAVGREIMDDAVIHTNSLGETNEYLGRAANNIYKDPNPQIIRRATTEVPITYEQRVLVRYLQPPAVPEPGPLIIKEVRSAQPPRPRPLVIREHASSLGSPPPLILRERPPTPPPYVPSETVTRCLPALPAPPRSVVIERFPPLPAKPRDIIIERWIPYGPQSKRRTIVEPAPPAIKYPESRNTIIVYGAVETRTARKFQNLGVIKENPADYIARYGQSLLRSESLIQQARNAGVIEDISPSTLSSSIYTNTRGNTDFDQSNEIVNRGFLLPGRTNCEGSQLATGTQTIDRGNTSYASSASKLIHKSRSQSGFHGGDASTITIRI